MARTQVPGGREPRVSRDLESGAAWELEPRRCPRQASLLCQIHTWMCPSPSPALLPQLFPISLGCLSPAKRGLGDTGPLLFTSLKKCFGRENFMREKKKIQLCLKLCLFPLVLGSWNKMPACPWRWRQEPAQLLARLHKATPPPWVGPGPGPGALPAALSPAERIAWTT